MKTPLLDFVELHLQVPRGAEGFWSIIVGLGSGGGEFTLADVDRQSNVHKSAVRDYVERLTAGGWLEVVRKDRIRGVDRNVYRLARQSAQAPRLRRDGSEHPEPARDRMWRAMKMLPTWTSADLAAATAAEDVDPVPVTTVKSYVARLVRAGIVQIMARPGSSSPATYRLLRNVGAAAPRILRAQLVYDPNHNEVLGPAEAEEV